MTVLVINYHPLINPQVINLRINLSSIVNSGLYFHLDINNECVIKFKAFELIKLRNYLIETWCPNSSEPLKK